MAIAHENVAINQKPNYMRVTKLEGVDPPYRHKINNHYSNLQVRGAFCLAEWLL